jgi:hypothetical protein
MRAKLGLTLLLGLIFTLALSLGLAQAQPPCPPGSHWSPRLQSCVAPPPVCPEGTVWSPRMNRCVVPARACPPGMVWVPGQGCRPVAPPPVVAPPPAVAPARPYVAPPPGLPMPGATMVVRASALSLRDCPGRRCRALAVLGPGEGVQYLDYRHGFALVRSLNSGLEGWVDYRYLALAP